MVDLQRKSMENYMKRLKEEEVLSEEDKKHKEEMIKMLEWNIEERNIIIKMIESKNIDTSSDDTEFDIKFNSETNTDMPLPGPHEDDSKASPKAEELLNPNKIKGEN